MTAATQAPRPLPRSKTISHADVLSALKAGFADYCRAPAFGLFFGGIFTIIGIVICLQFIVWGSSYWVLPMAVGFPLLGPFLAIGLAVGETIALVVLGFAPRPPSRRAL